MKDRFKQILSGRMEYSSTVEVMMSLIYT